MEHEAKQSSDLKSPRAAPASIPPLRAQGTESLQPGRLNVRHKDLRQLTKKMNPKTSSRTISNRSTIVSVPPSPGVNPAPVAQPASLKTHSARHLPKPPTQKKNPSSLTATKCVHARSRVPQRQDLLLHHQPGSMELSSTVPTLSSTPQPGTATIVTSRHRNPTTSEWLQAPQSSFFPPIYGTSFSWLSWFQVVLPSAFSALTDFAPNSCRPSRQNLVHLNQRR